MIIFGISPEYLGYVEEESKEFGFDLQAYGDLEDIERRLSKTNANDYYGFFYVGDSLGRDRKGLEKMIKWCDILSKGSDKKKRFVFSLKSEEGLDSLLRKTNIKNMEVYFRKFDIFTDLEIRHYVFGTILESHHSLYLEFDKEERSEFSETPKNTKLSYTPLFSSLTLDALENIVMKKDLSTTLVEDSYLHKLDSKSFLYNLRILAIKMKWKEPLDLEYFEEYFSGNYTEEEKLLYEYVMSGRVKEENKKAGMLYSVR